MSAQGDVQKAIVTKLKADVALNAKVTGRIYDTMPANPVFPYIRVGPLTEVPQRTFSSTAYEVTITLDIFSSQPANSEAQAILKLLNAAIDRQSLNTEAGFISCTYEFSTTLDEKECRHVPARYRVRVEINN